MVPVFSTSPSLYQRILLCMHACMQGLGLGQEALGILKLFGLTEQLEKINLPLPVEINTAVKPSGETKELQRDDHYNHRA